jgi:hypothetical protein
MAELTQSAGAGSCQVDGYAQGNEHRVDNTIFERKPFFFFPFKIKALGTGVCLESSTIPMYKEGNKTKPFELYQKNSLLAKQASHGLNLPEVHGLV